MKKLLSALVIGSLLACSPAKSGVLCSVPFTLTNGTTADASQVMANYNALIACLANAAAAGANTDISSLNGLTTPLIPSAGGTQTYTANATSTGTANAQTIAVATPSGFTLTPGKKIRWVSGFTNTSAMTLSVAGTTATNVFRASETGPVALTGGEVFANTMTEAAYDGTQFVLTSPAANTSLFLPTTGVSTNQSPGLTNFLNQYVATANLTFTLPRANTTFNGYAFSVYLPSAVNITFTPNGADTIDTTSGVGASLQLAGPGWMFLITDAAASGNWHIARKSYKLPNKVTFTASATYTPTFGMRYVVFEECGGGGAGGGAISVGGGQWALGGGGGSGAYTKGLLTAAQIGASQAITVGAAGVGASASAGGNGGTSSVGALMTAPGGGGGPVTGVLSGPGVVGVGAGAAAGSGGDVQVSGSPGSVGWTNGVSGSIAASGAGAASFFGAGAQAAIGTAGASNGVAAGANCAGGGGSIDIANSTAETGGNGGIGLVWGYEYFD